jgi:hypothetical protein
LNLGRSRTQASGLKKRGPTDLLALSRPFLLQGIEIRPKRGGDEVDWMTPLFRL